MLPITKISLPKYEEIENDIKQILESKRLTMGPYQKKLEEEFAEIVDAKHAIAVNSCTDGLTIAMKSLGLTGEVITTPFTYVATVHAIIHAGLKPRFVDIDKETFNLDPAAVEKELKKNNKVSAILPVHVFGQPCDISGLWDIAYKFKKEIIWDSAHCSGYSKYHLRKVGGFMTAEVCSLAPTKLATAGEGGIITVNDDELAKKCRMLSRLGLPQNIPGLPQVIDFQSDDRLFTEIGYNARIPEISCALALACQKHVDEWGAVREDRVALYKKELADTGLIFQKKESRTTSANFAFPIIVDPKKVGINRDQLQTELKKMEIESRKIWFYPIVTKQGCYIKKYGHMKLPNAEEISEQILCLPLHSEMSEDEVLIVCDAIKNILRDKNA